MASVGGDQEISSNSPAGETVRRDNSREGSLERKVVKDRDEKLKLARERQNEEKQRKIEELKAQAEAAQKYREETEEKRRRRIEEIRQRDSEKRQQVEERKRAIMEADKERREYILKKNQERESRLETKRRERSLSGFAFGSSTPRHLELTDFNVVSTSTFLGQRRSTSISNVAGASLSRRSSERELVDSGSKKRATSASGTDRHDDHHRKSSSMYEVFNWGYTNDEPPKRFSLSIVGSEINIDEPPRATARNFVSNSNSYITDNNVHNNNNSNNNFTNTPTATTTHSTYSNHYLTTTTTAGTTGSSHYTTKEDNIDASQIMFRSVARRKTDLMPTIPSPREGHYGSKSSLSNTPRTPGRAYSMNRLDQLAQPIRRNGEHIRAILERERREQLELLDETESLGGGRRVGGGRSKKAGGSTDGSNSIASMSRSMTHLASSSSQARAKYSVGGGISSSFRPLGSGGSNGGGVGGNRDACKSMTHLTNSWSPSAAARSNLGLQTTATKKYLQSSLASSASANKRQAGQHTTNPYRFDPNSLLLMNSSSVLVTAGSRSGNVTPGGSINASRPGSAMSTSTTLSNSGYVARRSVPAARKPRPASIAGTGVSLDEMNKLKKDKPPIKTLTPSTSAQTTPKRPSNVMSTSMFVTSSSSRLSSAEKKTPRRDTPNSKSSTPKSLSKTSSFDRLNKLNKDNNKPKDGTPSSITKTANVMAPTTISVKENVCTDIEKTKAAPPAQSKEEKDALNSIKTEEANVEATIPTLEQPTAVEQIEQNLSAKVEEKEKVDQGTEKSELIEFEEGNTSMTISTNTTTTTITTTTTNGNDKENVEVRESSPPATIQTGENIDLMSNSMMAKSKITTEEEAKAALAERRRLAREEAERQAELERQRIEAERLAELKRQEEEAERQRQFEEESTRLAAEQRKAEEERLRQAIEEAKQREEEERRKREEEERQRIEREEAEKKAKEEAEKQRLEVAERLKREEKEREERRKRVEAIMSRTRKGGAPNTPNSTPVKENNEANNKPTEAQAPSADVASASLTTTALATETTVGNQQSSQQPGSINSDSSSTSGSTTTATTPTPILSTQTAIIAPAEPPSTQELYEQSVIDKENALIHSFSNMIIDENAKNLQQQQQQQQPLQQTQFIDVFNGKLPNNETTLQNSTTITTTTVVANGNGHIENISNKNDINLLQDVVTPATNQLIDLSIQSQDLNDAVNFNNNNSLLATTNTTTLVTADSHENKDISLL